MKKNRIFQYLMSIVLCLYSFNASAENRLVIKLSTGTCSFSLNEQPVITFSGLKMEIKSQSFCHELKDIESFYFEASDKPTEISNIGNDDKIFQIEQDVVMSPQKIVIYDMLGKVIASSSQSSENRYSFDLYSLPKGGYIIKSGAITYKIYRK